MDLQIENRRIKLLGDTPAKRFFIQPVGTWDDKLPETEYAEIARLNPAGTRCLVTLSVEDWNRELSPWEADAAFGDEGFGSGAGETLAFLESSLFPALGKMFPAEGREYFLCGYSLAGLFALWAAYRTPRFAGVAAVSPSVWFPGWLEYAETHDVQSGAVYLSLGKKEEKTRNRTLAAVGDAIRAQYELLCAAGAACTLEWNDGNHFVNADKRLARGIAWLEKQSGAIKE